MGKVVTGGNRVILKTGFSQTMIRSLSCKTPSPELMGPDSLKVVPVVVCSDSELEFCQADIQESLVVVVSEYPSPKRLKLLVFDCVCVVVELESDTMEWDEPICVLFE